MRILAITPIRVTDEELARRRRRYEALSPQGVQVVLENLGTGSEVPDALNDPADIRASEMALIDRYAQVDPSEWDAFLPDCVLDPVVEHAHRFVLPVFGIGRLTAHFLSGQGAKVASVARNEAIARELDRKLKLYGVPQVQPTIVLGLSVADIADDATWGGAVSRRARKLDADYVINACSAVDIANGRRRPVVLDPTRTALELLALRQTLNGAAL